MWDPRKKYTANQICIYDYQNNPIYVNVFGQAIFQGNAEEHIVMVTEDKRVVTTDAEETVA